MSTSSNKRAITGLILVLIGALFLLDNLGYGIDLPRWLFSWPIVFVGIAVINIFTGNFQTGKTGTFAASALH